MANSPLAKKLLIKAGQRIAIVNPPPGYMDSLGELPEGVELADKVSGTFDFVQVFAKSVKELKRYAPKAIRCLKPDGMLWIAYPKASSKVQTDLTRDEGWEVIDESGLQGVALISIDDVWTACRFRSPDQIKKKKR